jgi:hypothetical protein
MILYSDTQKLAEKIGPMLCKPARIGQWIHRDERTGVLLAIPPLEWFDM